MRTNQVWTELQFADFLSTLYDYQTCGITRNWDNSRNVLTVRGYGAYPKADYDNVKYLTDEEVELAIQAGVEDWRIRTKKL